MSAPDIVYTATATASGGREGKVRTPDGVIDFDLRFPTEMGGSGGGVNPEQLFAAAYAGCFRGSLGRAAKERDADVSNATVSVSVGIGPHLESFGLTATVEVRLEGGDEAQLQELTERANQLCAYSKAVRGNIPVTLRSVVG